MTMLAPEVGLSNDAVVERFMHDHCVYNGISARRQRDVRKTLAAYTASLGGRSLLDTDSRDLYAYLGTHVERGLHPNTVRWIRNQIMPFYRWAHQRHLIDRMTLLDVRDVRPPRGASGNSTPRPYSRDELQVFWRALDTQLPVSEKFYGRWLAGTSRFRRILITARHWELQAIVALALYCGMRRVELSRATVNDVHPDNDYIVVHGAHKGTHAMELREREVPLPVGASNLMRPWFDFLDELDARGLLTTAKGPWLSLSRDRRWFLTEMPFSRLARVLSLWIGPGWELHRFRHTCATEWLRTTMGIEQVAVLMGHSNITRTLQYARVARQDVRATARRLEHYFDAAVGPKKLLEGGDDEQGPAA